MRSSAENIYILRLFNGAKKIYVWNSAWKRGEYNIHKERGEVRRRKNIERRGTERDRKRQLNCILFTMSDKSVSFNTR